MQRKNLVIGTGPLGWTVMENLVAQGETITLVNRRGQVDEPLPAGVHLAAADASNADEVARLSDEATTVFACAMPPYTQWPELFPPLMQGILDGVSRSGAKLIYGDNLYMYGPTGGQALHEDLPYAATGPKGRTRAQIATALLEAHAIGKARVSIGRASDFYGPRALVSVVGERFFGAVAAGKPAQVLGNVDLLHTFTYIDDYARGLITLSRYEAALGKAWHIPSAKPITMRALTDLVEAELGQSIRLQAAGSFLVSMLALFNPLMRELKETIYQWEMPFVVDHRRFEEAFGNQATPHPEAVKKTVAWFKQAQPVQM